MNYPRKLFFCFTAFAAETKTIFRPRILRRPAETGPNQHKKARSGVDDPQNVGQNPAAPSGAKGRHERQLENF